MRRVARRTLRCVARRTDATLVALAAGALVLAFSNGASAAPAAGTRTTVRVFAAASLSDAFKEIARGLEKEQPGLSIQLAFAGSQQLAAQIEQGAQADVFASADERWMSYVLSRNLVAAEPSVFARNALVVIVPKSNPARIGKLQDLARGGVKLVIGAEAVPVGAYSRTALRNLARDPAFGADFMTRTMRNVVSEEENVKSVVGKVQLGEADAGIVYRSDVTPAAARYIRSFDIPGASNVIAAYPIAVVRGSANQDAARAFVARVLSPEGQAVLMKHGFLAAAATAATPATPATAPATAPGTR
jgi:molybdate transport system substrate-binding protein